MKYTKKMLIANAMEKIQAFTDLLAKENKKDLVSIKK